MSAIMCHGGHVTKNGHKSNTRIVNHLLQHAERDVVAGSKTLPFPSGHLKELLHGQTRGIPHRCISLFVNE